MSFRYVKNIVLSKYLIVEIFIIGYLILIIVECMNCIKISKK